jgi:hypothetical protein
MAVAAESLGYRVTDLSRPGLRITEDVMEDMAAELREVISGCDDNPVIIFHLYDNNVYFAAGEDGSRSLPVKIGNTYHIPGKLEYADRQVLKNLVNTSAPLLRAGGSCPKFILSPLLRYLIISCCDDPAHITNRVEKKKFIRNMAARVLDMKDKMKDLVFGKRIKHFKVLSPHLLLLQGADEQEQAASLDSLWHGDPVHLVPGKYEVLVTALVERLETENFTNQHTNQHQRQPNSTSIGERVPIHHRRQSWVVDDDTLAHRDYRYERGNSARGRTGHGRGRGGRCMGRPFKRGGGQNRY